MKVTNTYLTICNIFNFKSTAQKLLFNDQVILRHKIRRDDKKTTAVREGERQYEHLMVLWRSLRIYDTLDKIYNSFCQIWWSFLGILSYHFMERSTEKTSEIIKSQGQICISWISTWSFDRVCNKIKCLI